MTTIIGMICGNGVVLGADSASTLLPRSEVEEHTYEITKQKIWISEPGIWRVMSATAGQAASGDWMKLAVEEYFRGIPEYSLGIIQHVKGVREHMLNELKNLGHAPRSSDSILLVFAGPGTSPNQILKFSSSNSKPEYFDYRKPFVAVGSGRRTAEPFLEFLRDVFWKEEPPTVAEGLVYVGWALMHTVSTQGSASGLPINLGSITGAEAPDIVQGEEADERFSRLMQNMKLAMQGVVDEFLAIGASDDDRGISKLKGI